MKRFRLPKFRVIVLLLLLVFLTLSFSHKSGAAKPSRPFTISLPANYTKTISSPLIILLPGYSKDNTYLKKELFPSTLSQGNYIIVTPLATKDRIGNFFWNTHAACCNFFHSSVNDIAYLTQLTNYLKSNYQVDSSHIYLLGHSNGGFMALTMACQRTKLYAAIISIAGANNIDQSLCKTAKPPSLLLIHGTKDEVISYQGGDLQGTLYPSAPLTLKYWLNKEQCQLPANEQKIDFLDSLPGMETLQASYSCQQGISIDFWSIDGGSHSPLVNSNFLPALKEYLQKHKLF